MSVICMAAVTGVVLCAQPAGLAAGARARV